MSVSVAEQKEKEREREGEREIESGRCDPNNGNSHVQTATNAFTFVSE